MEKDKHFEQVVVEMGGIPSEVMFDETDVRNIVNKAIIATKKVLEAERTASELQDWNTLKKNIHGK